MNGAETIKQATGISVGASTLTRVDIERRGDQISVVQVVSKTHEGSIKKVFESLLTGVDFTQAKSIALTGRKFKNLIRLSSISEPEAIEHAYMLLKKKYGEADYISCAGGETFTTYQLDAGDKVVNLFTGNKCASGTGEFFLQQIKRMGVSLEETAGMQNIEGAYRVSGRCSVFCKSDCTHALNKGQQKEKIIAGLCEMMALRLIEHLGENVSKRIWLTGGCSRNQMMVQFLQKYVAQLIIPEEASYFEALGSAIWALSNQTVQPGSITEIFQDEEKSFAILPALSTGVSQVDFKELRQTAATEGDRCLLGLDVGSTTTKAVLIRESDNGILASVYIKTLGDPVRAAKACYASLRDQISRGIRIIGFGVTGSGRQIAGLHALTENVYNEISAHAAAAVYFDPEVDTIFEIGGQDAKYTHIVNGVPCDYAMNEACSAGTGSFLEESAQEYLNIDVYQLGKVALESEQPPDFNDQCAAFIGSDIKTAMQENIEITDIVAGLVYSICKNYLNRVKGNRFVGRTIFMQGGVCYNKAVPIAMAALLNRKIVVPPEPGLMGAFGIALMVKEKISSGVVSEGNYDLDQLEKREAVYEKPFVCAGGNIKCDRRCSISLIRIEGARYPFGGICGKYSGVKAQGKNTSANNLVKLREEMVYGEFSFDLHAQRGKTIGINRSLLVSSLFPLYYNFFDKLGLQVILPDKIIQSDQGLVKKDSAFCYPVNLAHEYFKELAGVDPDYLFLPHVKGMPVINGIRTSLTCPLVQGESYYLRTTFEVDEAKVLAPVLDFAGGYDAIPKAFIELGSRLGFGRQESLAAYRHGVQVQEAFGKRCREIGEAFLNELARTGEQAIVLFGRPYNALVKDGNMGIPDKIASRGFKVIPYDFLPFDEETPQKKMYWSMGQMLMKAAKLVSKHPQLFGAFVSNFSCGPDSFLVGYFRDIMGSKPSLTLELDSHTADAGIDTRIDAFIDVIMNYQPVAGDEAGKEVEVLSSFDYRRKKIRTVRGEYISLRDPRVQILLPSMGVLSSRCMAAAFKHIGIDALALNPPAEEELQLGRANSSCKECLPLALTVGSLLNYFKKNGSGFKKNGSDGVIVFFMPAAPDPCRFGQYHVYTENLMKKMGIDNVALLSLSSGNSYAGLGVEFTRRAWQALVISDVLEDIRSALLALALDRGQAMELFFSSVDEIVKSLESDSWREVKEVLTTTAARLSRIPLRQALEEARKVALVGEIYVRRDGFSRQYLVEKLAARGIVTRVVPIAEWIYYCDYTVKNDLSNETDVKDKFNVFVEGYFRKKFELEIKSILATSGLCECNIIDVDRIVAIAEQLISPHIVGEAILTVGTSIAEIIDHVDGVISIGPFGCMPSRISEAILNEKMSTHKSKISSRRMIREVLERYPHLPFLNIETDGSAFSQLIEIRLEAFILQVNRINEFVRQLKANAEGAWH